MLDQPGTRRERRLVDEFSVISSCHNAFWVGNVIPAAETCCSKPRATRTATHARHDVGSLCCSKERGNHIGNLMFVATDGDSEQVVEEAVLKHAMQFYTIVVVETDDRTLTDHIGQSVGTFSC